MLQTGDDECSICQEWNLGNQASRDVIKRSVKI